MISTILAFYEFFDCKLAHALSPTGAMCSTPNTPTASVCVSLLLSSVMCRSSACSDAQVAMPIGAIVSIFRPTIPVISSKMGIAWMSSGKQNANKYRKIFMFLRARYVGFEIFD